MTGDTASLPQRRLGDRTVGSIGLGGMPMSIEGRPDRARAVATVHAALEAGVTLIDTADAYHWHADEVGHNEELIGEALRSWGGDSSDVLVATKGGQVRPGDGTWHPRGHPERLKKVARESAGRLGVESIGLYQLHRPDPDVPWEDSVGALAELLDAGVIERAGISNADSDQITSAQEVLGGRLTSVQNQFNPAFRTSQVELDLCAELGIAFLPWGPLSGIADAPSLGSRFTRFAEVAAGHGVSPQVVCLAWELAKSDVVIPIPGSSRPETTRDSITATSLDLSADELALLDLSD